MNMLASLLLLTTVAGFISCQTPRHCSLKFFAEPACQVTAIATGANETRQCYDPDGDLECRASNEAPNRSWMNHHRCYYKPGVTGNQAYQAKSAKCDNDDDCIGNHLCCHTDCFEGFDACQPHQRCRLTPECTTTDDCYPHPDVECGANNRCALKPTDCTDCTDCPFGECLADLEVCFEPLARRSLAYMKFCDDSADCIGSTEECCQDPFFPFIGTRKVCRPEGACNDDSSSSGSEEDDE